MRVNLEESVFEHIPRLAREMKWDENRALGMLVRVYRATQKAEVHEEKPARLVTICALDFDSDDDAERFFTAMIAAQLACVLEDGRLRIRGNGDHIERLKRYRARAQRGGIARSKKSNHFGASKQPQSSHKAATPLSTSEPSYAPMLLCSLQEETTKNLDPAAEPKPKRKRKTSPAAAQPGVTVQVRDAYVAAFKKRYPTMRPIWGPKEGGQCAQLLTRYTADELVELIRYYFAWKRPNVMKGGHHFGDGPVCFVVSLPELRGDIADPDRRREAANVAKLEQDADRNSQQQDQAARVVAQILGAANAPRIDNPAPARGLNYPDHAALRDVHEEAIGYGHEDVD